VIAVAGLDDLLAFAGESAELHDQRERLLAYRARYGRPAHRSDASSGGTAR
jgi:orotate phosphoribosyltransferase